MVQFCRRRPAQGCCRAHAPRVKERVGGMVDWTAEANWICRAALRDVDSTPWWMCELNITIKPSVKLVTVNGTPIIGWAILGESIQCGKDRRHVTLNNPSFPRIFLGHLPYICTCNGCFPFWKACFLQPASGWSKTHHIQYAGAEMSQQMPDFKTLLSCKTQGDLLSSDSLS